MNAAALETSPLYSVDVSHLALALGLIGVTIFISKAAHLRLETSFAGAALRSIVQLSLIGYALRWLFAASSGLLNFLILSVMTLIAAQTVVQRVSQKHWRLFFFVLLALILGVWPVAIAVIFGAFGLDSLSDAKFVIPLLGLLLGNALSGISLIFIQLQKIRQESLPEIEALLALGASPFEASISRYREALKQALTPILNAMSIVGLVSLPGAMAGQVLGGVDPVVAGRMQILIMLLLLVTSFFGAIIAIVLFHFFEMPPWVRRTQTTVHLPDTRSASFSGDSGIGKTRLFKTWVGLDNKSLPSALPVKTVAIYRTHVNYLSQRPIFIVGTVRENLELPFHFDIHRDRKFPDGQVRAYIRDLGLTETILDASAQTLSGGEAQLIHLIRSLILDPEALLLDEPTSALDPKKTLAYETQIARWLKESPQRRLFLISHDEGQRRRVCESHFHLDVEGIRNA